MEGIVDFIIALFLLGAGFSLVLYCLLISLLLFSTLVLPSRKFLVNAKSIISF